MKKILITGENSYIGNSFQNWVSQYKEEYKVDTISVRDNKWKSKSFSEYDVVLHVAGIAHIKETKENKDLYYKVNRDLAIDVAKKSKEDGIKQFIFLSSMSVYGMNQGIITTNTIEKPKSSYGISKLEAENEIKKLIDEKFIVSILRPPMVYGKGCKGNYVSLDKLTNKVQFFPKVENERSMIHIDNLSEFIRIIIDKEITDILYPQNEQFVCTSELVRKIGLNKNKKIFLIGGFNYLINLLSKKIILIQKVFGTLIYDKKLSDIGYKYNVFKFDETIRRSINER